MEVFVLIVFLDVFVFISIFFVFRNKIICIYGIVNKIICIFIGLKIILSNPKTTQIFTTVSILMDSFINITQLKIIHLRFQVRADPFPSYSISKLGEEFN